MPDREKVIRGLECCLSPNDHENCPYDGIGKTYSHCLKKLVTDAFALLKEQEEGVTPIESTTEQKKFADRIGFAVSEYWCGDCHFNLFNRPKFCPNCGKKVKWDA